MQQCKLSNWLMVLVIEDNLVSAKWNDESRKNNLDFKKDSLKKMWTNFSHYSETISRNVYCTVHVLVCAGDPLFLWLMMCS